MGVAETALEVENQRAGRFLSGARYWFGYTVVAVAYLAGTIAGKADLDFWWRGGIVAALFLAYTGLFRKFKKREIN